MAGGVDFQDQVEAAATPLEVAPGELKRLLRQDIRILGTPTFENGRLRIKGRPDGIDVARGALYPIEVKSHKAVTALDELELAFYWLLLAPHRTRRDVAPRGLVVLRRQGKAVTVEVAIGQHRLDRVAELLGEIRRARHYRVRPQVCGCRVCSTVVHGEVMASVSAARHLTLIHGVGRARAAALQACGYPNWESLVDADPAQVWAGVVGGGWPNPGLAGVRLWQLHARSYWLAVPLVAEGAKFPLGRRFVAVDLEYIPERPHILLVGATVVDGDRRRQLSVWADTPDEELAALKELAGLLADHRRLPVVSWNGAAADLPQLLGAARRHGAGDLFDPLVARHVDLYRWAQLNVRLPIPGLGLKDVGGYFGHPRSDSVTDGLQALLLYQRYLATNDPGIRAQLVDYNRGDLVELIEVAGQLRALTDGSEPRGVRLAG